MIAQDLEDLLYSKLFFKSDTRQIRDVMLEIEDELRADGRKYVITRIFSDNTTRVGVTVTLHADPNSGKEVKEVAIEHKSIESVYAIEVVYYDPVEVERFVASVSEI